MLFVGIKNNLLIEKPPLIIHRSVAFVNRDLSMFPTWLHEARTCERDLVDLMLCMPIWQWQVASSPHHCGSTTCAYNSTKPWLESLFFWVLISLQHVVQFRKAAVLISCLCVLFVDYAHKTSNYIKWNWPCDRKFIQSNINACYIFHLCWIPELMFQSIHASYDSYIWASWTDVCFL
jgi:hypothetical protein